MPFDPHPQSTLLRRWGREEGISISNLTLAEIITKIGKDESFIREVYEALINHFGADMLFYHLCKHISKQRYTFMEGE